jgi:putative protein kinase ArgK-like GTPase of G3E family
VRQRRGDARRPRRAPATGARSRRLLTLIDDDAPGARDAARAARRARRPRLGRRRHRRSRQRQVDARRRAARRLARRGHTIAVVAIDPSSPISGGAVLGDRIRMGANAAHPNVFIRSFSARGELGGLSRAARAAVDAFDACGFDRVIVETVGTGQSETAIVALADTRVVVCPPGSATTSRRSRPGTLEIADVLAVSKGDLPLAEQTAREMREMLTLRRRAGDGDWAPRVVVVSALARTGIEALLAAMEAHRDAIGVCRAPARADGASGTAPTARPRCDRDARAPGMARAHRRARSRATACAGRSASRSARRPGRAEVAMTVDARHLNFNGGCHGGAIFALADARSAWRRTRTARSRAGSTRTSRSRPRSPRRHAASRARARVQRSRASASTGSTSCARTRRGETAVSSFTGTVYIKAEPAALEAGPAPGQGYTRGCCPVVCRRNDNMASKHS